MRARSLITSLCVAAAAIASTACSPGESHAEDGLGGAVEIDGSSTVYPISLAVAEEFRKEHPGVRTTIAVSGTGGGFKRFTKGETDISDASRPIKSSELDVARQNGIEFIEVPVAYDGLSIVVNHDNQFVDHLTVAELRKIFTDTSVTKWSQVRAGWPDQAVKIYMPGTDSGTFDYFKEVVVEEGGSMRSGDMVQTSEDDNVLVRGVAGDKGAIGFFGCAYYFENEDKLRAVPIAENGGQPVLPKKETIENGSYHPFSRPLFIYVNQKSIDEKPQVTAFVDFYLAQGPSLAEEVGYVKLPGSIMERSKAHVAQRKTGTSYLDAQGQKRQGSLAEIYK